MHTVIIGGGVAGLACANHLAEEGAQVTLVEANPFPAHKVCGEFFSPECLPILERWEVAPSIPITTARFNLGQRVFSFPLPTPARSESRYTFDARLATRAEQIGTKVLTGVRCTGLEKKGGVWEVSLEGEELEASTVVIGTGRLTGQKKPHFPYRGYKAHFEGSRQSVLEMHLFPGAYLGISSVAEGVVNVACLTKTSARPIEELLPSSLKGRRLFDWLEVAAPEFGVKLVPDWEGALFIGDAAGTIAPICGDGLAMGITSGVMAAEHILQGKEALFRKAWLKRYASRIRLGKVLSQSALTAPNLATLVHHCPPLFRTLFHKTREIPPKPLIIRH